MGQEFRWKSIEEKKNYFLEELEQNELMSKKPSKICATLNILNTLLILVVEVTGCISISAFAFLLDISIRISTSAIWLEIFAITAGIKKHKLIIIKR